MYHELFSIRSPYLNFRYPWSAWYFDLLDLLKLLDILDYLYHLDLLGRLDLLELHDLLGLLEVSVRLPIFLYFPIFPIFFYIFISKSVSFVIMFLRILKLTFLKGKILFLEIKILVSSYKSELKSVFLILSNKCSKNTSGQVFYHRFSPFF